MPKRTLLQMVQKVAEKISSDEISSLGETVEAERIETILNDMLEDLVTRQDWEFLKDNLGTLSDGSTAISLVVPDDVSKLQTVRYRRVNDTKPYTLHYLHPEDYLHRMQQLPTTEPNSVTVTVNGIDLVAKTDRDPRYWTILQDEVYVDAYDVSRDTTGVVGAQSVILYTKYFDFTGNDQPTWTAPLPEKLFQLWLQESVAEAAVKLRQVEDPREERKARRQYISQSRDEPVYKRDEGSGVVNYGR